MFKHCKHCIFLVLVLFFLVSGSPICLATPSATTDETPQGKEDVDVEKKSTAEKIFDAILGQPADTTVYLGMWSQHVTNQQEDYNTTNNLVGLCYEGYFLGTFMNSFDDRGWSAGFQRDVYQKDYYESSLRAGYRVGLIYGYEELSLYDTKLFPMLQLYADLSYKKVGVEFSWAGSVFTAGFFYRF